MGRSRGAGDRSGRGGHAGVDRLEPPDHTCPGYLLMADGARAALVRTAGGWTTEMVR
ncbi:MAG: hypothetical protein IPG97_03075 [Microthrixaceae bacterium]|nr:hypothetical protein [Microthrixaceae bacterium]